MSLNHYFRTMQTNKRILIVSAIIIGAALTRLIPHPMNFAPLGAMALFGSAYLSRNGVGLFATMMAMSSTTARVWTSVNPTSCRTV